MTPRPGFASKRRPVSAIYLGTNPPPNLPDLPEPPSPGAESNDSGLPSPPATNSTGSGSAGDDAASSHGGSLRRRSTAALDTATTNMLNGSDDKSHISRTISTSPELDTHPNNDDDDDDDEDTTARLSHGRRRTFQASTENAMALQRVRSLTERNRMVRGHTMLYWCRLLKRHIGTSNLSALSVRLQFYHHLATFSLYALY